MPSPNAVVRLVKDWASRHWPLLSALGYALAFAVTFGGVALAAYTSGFTSPVMSLACGAVVIWLLKLYVRGIRAMQRLIARLHPPKSGQVASPDKVPGWAFHLYTLLFVVLMFRAGVQTNIYPILGWAAGQEVLRYFFWRQSDPAAPSAFAVIDDALDRFVELHRPLLRKLEIILGFIALSGGVALHAFHSGFTAAVALGYAGANVIMQIAIAAGYGASAVVFARFYVAITIAAQRVLIDPWRYVRPEPPSREVERWALYVFLAIGLMLFLTMSFVGVEQAAGNTTIIVEAKHFKIEIGSVGLLALFVGWGCGGYRVLRYFWARARVRAEQTNAPA